MSNSSDVNIKVLGFDFVLGFSCRVYICLGFSLGFRA